MKKLLISAVAITMVACSNEYSFNTVETARDTAIKNGAFNAKAYANKHFPESSIFTRGDSTISKTCPQGDGWVTVDLTDLDGVVTEHKCSSVSSRLGCMSVADFKKRPAFSSQEGSCDQDLPHPLPKLGK